MASDWVAAIELAVLAEEQGLDENLVAALVRSALPTVRSTPSRERIKGAILSAFGRNQNGEKRSAGGKGGAAKALAGALVQPKNKPKGGNTDGGASKQSRLWYLQRKAKEGSISSAERSELTLLQQKRKEGRLAKVNRGARSKQPNPKGVA